MLFSYIQFFSFLVAFSLMPLHSSIKEILFHGITRHCLKGWTNNLGMNLHVACVNKLKTWLLNILAFLDK